MTPDYFRRLYEVSRQFIEELSLPQQPTPLQELLTRWRPSIEADKGRHLVRLRACRDQLQAAPPAPAGAAPAGLNTVGMLCDRLTVVTMKEWVLATRLNKVEEAARLRDTQIRELVDVLARIQPGHSSFTQKVTTLRYDTQATTWEEAYFGLLAVNTLLWEAQEVLYAGRLADLPAEEIRRYIAWFSEGNIRRNEYIAQCEKTFWAMVRDPGACHA